MRIFGDKRRFDRETINIHRKLFISISSSLSENFFARIFGDKNGEVTERRIYIRPREHADRFLPKNTEKKEELPIESSPSSCLHQ